MSKQIKVLSLLNGQELVGEVEINFAGEQYTVYSPLVIVPQQGPSPDQMGFGFMPWPVFGMSESYDIAFAQVIVAYEPRKEVADGYTATMQRVNAQKSGIVMPTKPRLIIE